MNDQYTVGDITIDTINMTVTKAGQSVNLTRREYEILLYLTRADRRPVSARELAREVFPEPVLENTAEVYIRYLRLKIGQDAIVNRRGFGYNVKVQGVA